MITGYAVDKMYVEYGFAVLKAMHPDFDEWYASFHAETQQVSHQLLDTAKKVLIVYWYLEHDPCQSPEIAVASSLGAAYIVLMKQCTGQHCAVSEQMVKCLVKMLGKHYDPLEGGKRMSKVEMQDTVKTLVEKMRSTFTTLYFLHQLWPIKLLTDRTPDEEGVTEANMNKFTDDGWIKFVSNLHDVIMRTLEALPVPTPLSKTKTIISKWIEFMELDPAIERISHDLAGKFLKRNDDGGPFFEEEGCWLVAAAAIGLSLANCRYSSVVRLSGVAESLFFACGKFTYTDVWAVRSEMIKFDAEVLQALKLIEAGNTLNFLVGNRNYRNSWYEADRAGNADEYTLSVYRAATFRQIGDPADEEEY